MSSPILILLSYPNINITDWTVTSTSKANIMLTPKIMHISISTNLSHIRPSNCYPHPFINILVKVNSKHPTIIISPHLWCGWGPPPEKLLARGIHAVSREPGMHEKSKHCCIYEFVIIKGNNDKYKENDNKHNKSCHKKSKNHERGI